MSSNPFDVTCLTFDIRQAINNPNIQLEMQHTYKKYGVIVCSNVLTVEECQETKYELAHFIQTNCQKPNYPTFNLEDSTTFDSANLNNYGVIGKEALFLPTLLRNRYHHNVQSAYSIIYNRPIDDLTACHDRAAWMRPTLDKYGIYNPLYDTPFTYPGLHLDINARGYFTQGYETEVYKFINSLTYKSPGDFFKENNAKHCTMGTRLQGVLSLTDNRLEDGGFHCCLGGHNTLKQWYDLSALFKTDRYPIMPNGNYVFTTESDQDHMFFETTRITCSAGSLIIFDATLPHGTLPNTSDHDRMIQFLRYEVKNTFSKNTYDRRSKAILSLAKQCNYKFTKEELRTV